MTYAGLKSMIYAGVGPDDPRVKAALDWIKKHYTVKENPGMEDAGLYYYYHTFAKALDALRQDVIADADGTTARLAAGAARRAGQPAAGRRQLGERQRALDGGRSQPRHRLRPVDSHPLAASEVIPPRILAPLVLARWCCRSPSA